MKTLKTSAVVLFSIFMCATAYADITINDVTVAALDFKEDGTIILKINELDKILAANSCADNSFSADLNSAFGKASWTSLMAAMTNSLPVARLDYARESTAGPNGTTIWKCTYKLVELRN